MYLSIVQSSAALLEFAKILLPTGVGAIIALLLLRRLEQVKCEVARHSDFNRKWAELFFDSSNTFLVSSERFLALYYMLTVVAEPNNEWGIGLQRQVNDLLPVLKENSFRIQRLVALAPSQGPAAWAAANRLFESIAVLTKTRTANVEELRGQIDEFSHAARTAHSEMLASRSLT